MTTASVPTLYQEHDTFIHHRDPRVKILLFLILFLYLFVAPTWEWLLVAMILGLIMGVVARTPWRWVLVLWAIHIPTFLALIIFPTFGELIKGNFAAIWETALAELRLILAWTTAIIISVTLFSTVDAEGLVKGVRGLRLPAIVAFAVGLSYRLLYVTMAEAVRISNAMKIKGVELDPKHPFRFILNVLRLSLPVMFAVLRRAPTLMSALNMRGFSKRLPGLGKFDLGDWFLLLIGVALLALAACAKFDVLPFTLSFSTLWDAVSGSSSNSTPSSSPSPSPSK